MNFGNGVRVVFYMIVIGLLLAILLFGSWKVLARLGVIVTLVVGFFVWGAYDREAARNAEQNTKIAQLAQFCAQPRPVLLHESNPPTVEDIMTNTDMQIWDGRCHH